MRPVMKVVFFVLFLAVSAVHLYDSWRDEPKRRAKTKPFLIPLLLLAYVAAAENVSWFLVFALLTSWLGDVLLIPSGTKWFVSGGISFLISHILFILVYLHAGAKPTAAALPVLLPAAAVYLAVSVAVTLSLRGNCPKMMIVPMILYLVANSAMNVMALALLLTLRSPGAVLAYLGAVFFFISDCTLYLVRYHKHGDKIFKKHFTVMLTYLLGEALITAGVWMIG